MSCQRPQMRPLNDVSICVQIELQRITKRDDTLVVDDGHAPREETKKKILDSGIWNIVEETKDHLKCRPVYGKSRKNK